MSRKSTANKKRLLRLAVITALSASAISFGYASYASNEANSSDVWSIPYSTIGNTPLTYSYNISAVASNNFALNSSENLDMVVKARIEAEQAVEKSSTECADSSSSGSLGEVQKNELDKQRIKDLASVDLDKIFKIGKKNNCFDALQDFPDLSVNIPTLSGILDAVKKTLTTYATRKVCSVVDEAMQGMLEPVKSQLDKISDEKTFDLNGRVNKKLAKQLYEIDPELGRVSRPNSDSKDIDIEFKW